jgi:hypothetical protein
MDILRPRRSHAASRSRRLPCPEEPRPLRPRHHSLTSTRPASGGGRTTRPVRVEPRWRRTEAAWRRTRPRRGFARKVTQSDRSARRRSPSPPPTLGPGYSARILCGYFSTWPFTSSKDAVTSRDLPGWGGLRASRQKTPRSRSRIGSRRDRPGRWPWRMTCNEWNRQWFSSTRHRREPIGSISLSRGIAPNLL